MNNPEAVLSKAPWANEEEKKKIQDAKVLSNLVFALERAIRARDAAQKDIDRIQKELDKTV